MTHDCHEFAAVRTEDGFSVYGLAAYVKRTYAQGEEFRITVTSEENLRSLKANAYYWGHVLDEMAKTTGHTPEELHDEMCARFLPKLETRASFFREVTGEDLVIPVDPRRSSRKSRTQFYDFVEQVREFARSFLNCETEDPDPQWWRKRQQATRAA